MGKIELTDNLIDIMFKMSEGNPGCVAALSDIIENTKKIDPQSALGGLGNILTFDDLGIYGTDIYIYFME